MNIKYQDDIDKLLLNQMSTMERIWFNLLYGWRSEVKEQLSFTLDVMRAIQSRQQKLDLMREWAEERRKKDLQTAAELASDLEQQIQKIHNEIESLESVIRREEREYLERKDSLSSQIRDLEAQIEVITNEFKEQQERIIGRIQELKKELNRISGNK